MMTAVGWWGAPPVDVVLAAPSRGASAVAGLVAPGVLLPGRARGSVGGPDSRIAASAHRRHPVCDRARRTVRCERPLPPRSLGRDVAATDGAARPRDDLRDDRRQL